MIPEALNETASDAEVAELETKALGLAPKDKNPKANIGWGTLITNRHTFFSLLIMFLGTADVMFFKVFFVLELDETYNIDEENAGYLLATTSFVYLVACLSLPYTCEHSPRKLLFFLSMIGFGCCCFLLGPSELLGFPESFGLMVSSLPIMGIFQVFVFIPIIPEMLERLQVDLQIKEGEDEMVDLRLNDIVNESYTLLFALSNFVAPLLGTWLYEHFGMRKTCDYFALFNIAIGIISFVFNCGFSVFSENRDFNKKLQILKGEEDEDVETTEGKQPRKTFARGGGTFHAKGGGRNNQFSSVYMRNKRAYMGNANSVYNKMHNEISVRKANMSHYQKMTGMTIYDKNQSKSVYTKA